MSFTPVHHQFIKVTHNNPWKLDFFELANHQKVDGVADFSRLNVYLSKDREFCTIWNGLLEPMSTASLLKKKKAVLPEGFDFNQYQEPLFRGFIESDDQATHILKALRLKNVVISQLRVKADGGLSCDLIE